MPCQTNSRTVSASFTTSRNLLRLILVLNYTGVALCLQCMHSDGHFYTLTFADGVYSAVDEIIIV